MNRPKVAVGGLGFVFTLNVVQHHRLGIAEFFSKVSVVVVVVHGHLVGERGDLGCRTRWRGCGGDDGGDSSESMVTKVGAKKMVFTSIYHGRWFLHCAVASTYHGFLGGLFGVVVLKMVKERKRNSSVEGEGK
ncbi:hypothetical protein GOBAR_DD28187 [Gossypium barbadense]|nr:hypothetical protein GOBAR_DD28187 [Gossypium barbadense]